MGLRMVISLMRRFEERHFESLEDVFSRRNERIIVGSGKRFVLKFNLCVPFNR